MKSAATECKILTLSDIRLGMRFGDQRINLGARHQEGAYSENIARAWTICSWRGSDRLDGAETPVGINVFGQAIPSGANHRQRFFAIQHSVLYAPGYPVDKKR